MTHEKQEEWSHILQTFVDRIGSHLGKHGKYFVCGMKPTIADFAVAGLMFSFIN